MKQLRTRDHEHEHSEERKSKPEPYYQPLKFSMSPKVQNLRNQLANTLNIRNLPAQPFGERENSSGNKSMSKSSSDPSFHSDRYFNMRFQNMKSGTVLSDNSSQHDDACMMVEDEPDAGHRVQEVRRIFTDFHSNLFRTSTMTASTKDASTKGSILFKKQQEDPKKKGNEAQEIKRAGTFQNRDSTATNQKEAYRTMEAIKSDPRATLKLQLSAQKVKQSLASPNQFVSPATSKYSSNQKMPEKSKLSDSNSGSKDIVSLRKGENQQLRIPKKKNDLAFKQGMKPLYNKQMNENMKTNVKAEPIIQKKKSLLHQNAQDQKLNSKEKQRITERDCSQNQELKEATLQVSSLFNISIEKILPSTTPLRLTQQNKDGSQQKKDSASPSTFKISLPVIQQETAYEQASIDTTHQIVQQLSNAIQISSRSSFNYQPKFFRPQESGLITPVENKFVHSHRGSIHKDQNQKHDESYAEDLSFEKLENQVVSNLHRNDFNKCEIQFDGSKLPMHSPFSKHSVLNTSNGALQTQTTNGNGHQGIWAKKQSGGSLVNSRSNSFSQKPPLNRQVK